MEPNDRGEIPYQTIPNGPPWGPASVTKVNMELEG